MDPSILRQHALVAENPSDRQAFRDAADEIDRLRARLALAERTIAAVQAHMVPSFHSDTRTYAPMMKALAEWEAGKA